VLEKTIRASNSCLGGSAGRDGAGELHADASAPWPDMGAVQRGKGTLAERLAQALLTHGVDVSGGVLPAWAIILDGRHAPAETKQRHRSGGAQLWKDF